MCTRTVACPRAAQAAHVALSMMVMLPLCSSGDELLGTGVNKLNPSLPSKAVLELSSLQMVKGSLSTQLEARSSRLEA